MSESTPPVIGGSRDTHGCLIGAGYSWSTLAGQCIRSWESRVRIITIAPDMTPCVYGLMQTECLQMRTGRMSWSPLYGGISGFDFTPGSTYRLRVLETRAERLQPDGSPISYTFLRMLSKKSVQKNDENLLGDWKLQAYQQGDMIFTVDNLPLSFMADRYSAKFCNTINGSYKARNGTLTSGPGMSTLMYCEGQLMTLEGAFSLNGASYAITSPRGGSAASISLRIMTAKGGVFTYTK
jgi:heat shock protein HslJ